MRICIFEDAKVEDLAPINLVRPTFELRCGAVSLRERILRGYDGGGDTCCFVRDHLAPVYRRVAGAPVNDPAALRGDDLLLINGRMLALGDWPAAAGDDEIGLSGDDVAYARLSAATAEALEAPEAVTLLARARQKVKTVPAPQTLIRYPWDLIEHNGKCIEADFAALPQKGVRGEMAEMSVIYGPADRVYVAPGAQVHPLVVLDTHGGPIIIEAGAKIFPHTRIEGPGCIGPDTHIVGGKIREGCAIGPMCRVGGEVEESIIHGYSNKYHDGFLGHAYVGEGVNLGALTTNSDLKNDYGNVELYLRGELVDSGSIKVGCFIGDHTKTSIGTLFNTGTIVGVGCLILGGSEILPKYIPSFAWYYNGHVAKGAGFDAFIATARTAMGRRGVELTADDIELLRTVRELTKTERNEAIRKARRT
jgi:UDP-N-acetylglucosamine diphosphorylase/glucosamine-1-phosphate N-acetyltransferase